MKSKRTFSKEYKFKVLKEAASIGVKETLAKYNIYPSVYYKWKKKYLVTDDTLETIGVNSEHLKRIRELEKQVKAYKEIVAEKELEIRLHEDVKKKWALEKKNK